MILFLLILNIILLIINLKGNEYIITNAQKQAILEYAEKNNIKISAKIPEKFYPMNSISVKNFFYDENQLKNIFFGTDENITQNEELGMTIFEKDDKKLYINKSYIAFEDTALSDFIFEKDFALKKAKEIVKELSDICGKMYLDLVIEEDDCFNIFYVQKIDGYKVFSNFCNIKIFEDGKMELSFNYYQKIEELTETKNICSADEAIYTFLKEIRNLFDTEIEITQIDLGYYLGNTEETYQYVFKPYYRFCVKDTEEVFFVNAYTNTFEINTKYSILENFK